MLCWVEWCGASSSTCGCSHLGFSALAYNFMSNSFSYRFSSGLGSSVSKKSIRWSIMYEHYERSPSSDKKSKTEIKRYNILLHSVTTVKKTTISFPTVCYSATAEHYPLFHITLFIPWTSMQLIDLMHWKALLVLIWSTNFMYSYAICQMTSRELSAYMSKL